MSEILLFTFFKLTRYILNFNTAFTKKKKKKNSTRLIYRRVEKWIESEKNFPRKRISIIFTHSGEIIDINNNRLVQRSPRHRLG